MKWKVLVALVFLSQSVFAGTGSGLVIGMAVGSASRSGEVGALEDRIKALERENAQLRSIFQMQAQQLGMEGFVYIPPPKVNPCEGLTVKACRESVRKKRGY